MPRPRATGGRAPAGRSRAYQRANRSSRGGGRAAANRATREQKQGGRVEKQIYHQQRGGQELEQEPPRHERVAALIESAWPGKRRASNSYDDTIVKRRRTSSLLSMPWDGSEEIHGPSGEEIEKPPYDARDLVDSTNLDASRLGHPDHDSAAALGEFAKLPTEIRDMILRNLLVHYDDIRVLRGWSLVYPRSRPNLDADILRACRVFHRQGVRILYGENTFVYLNRDPAKWRDDTHIVVRYVYDRDHLPVDKYGHLIRRVKVVVEANRMLHHDSRANLPIALQKFLPDLSGLALPAQLHTVTIELPAMTRAMLRMEVDPSTKRTDVPACAWFSRDSSVLDALKKLNCQYICIIARLQDNTCYEAIIDRRPHFSKLSADAGNFDVWSGDNLIQVTRKREAVRSRARLESMHYWLKQLVEDNGMGENRVRARLLNPDRAVLEGPFRYHVPEVTIGPLEALPSGSSTRSSRRGAAACIDYGGLTEDFLNDRNGDAAMTDDSSNDGYSMMDDDDEDEDDETMFVSNRRSRR